MQILGYIAYAALLFFAVAWTLGVRVKKDTEVSTIIGAMVFLFSAILIPLLQLPWLYSFVFIALGFVTPFIVLLISSAVPPLFQLLRFVAGMFANIVRAGS